MAMALFIAIVAVVVAPYSRYRYRIGYVQPGHTPPRGFYANRLILEIKIY